VGSILLVLAGDGSPVRAQPPDDFPGLRVVGRHLYDRYGNKIVLVGVNKMVIWTDRDGLPAFPEIARTGANAVRIVWLTEGPANQLDTAISNAVEHKLIPMVDCHDSTGDWDLFGACVDYWLQPDVLSVLKKHEEYLIVNIANEPVENYILDRKYRAAYELAIKRLRAAGIHVPLVVDAQGFGKGIDNLQKNAPYLIQADPDHNLIFSIHIYWPTKTYGPAVDQLVIDEIAESVEMDLPLIVGEFANVAWQCACCIPYKTIIEQCHLNEYGYFAWSWGPGNRDCKDMDMTADGTFDTLQGWGLEVALTDPYSIKNVAVRPDWIVNATPIPAETPTPAPTELLSIGRPVAVSSAEGPDLAGEYAVDGSLQTRWGSAFSDPQEITVDLEAVVDIGGVVLEWEAAYGQEYTVDLSDDGVTWDEAYHETDGDGGTDVIPLEASARYVRLSGIRRGTEWGYSLWEFSVYGPGALPTPTPEVTPKDDLPDLVVTGISWEPALAIMGSAVTFRATVENQGGGATSEGAVHRCLFQVNGETVAWADGHTASIAPGESVTLVASGGPDGDATWDAEVGDMIVFAWVDDEGRVTEGDELNNMVTVFDQVLLRAPTPTWTPRPTSTATREPEVTATVTPAPTSTATPEPVPAATPMPGLRGWVVVGALVVGAVAVAVALWRRKR
jgi:mannan endo-1,4-beta-mannosidase